MIRTSKLASSFQLKNDKYLIDFVLNLLDEFLLIKLDYVKNKIEELIHKRLVLRFLLIFNFLDRKQCR